MKKFVQIISLIMAFVTAFAIGSYAADEADVTEPTTAVQEMTTTQPEVTQPEEDATTQPDVTEPEVTEPEVTEPAAPEIDLPATPGFLRQDGYTNDGFKAQWGYVREADGYNLYIKSDDEWVLNLTTTETSAYVKDILLSRWYNVGVKSYKMVDGVMYESADFCTDLMHTGWISFGPVVNAVSVKEGIKLTWTRYGVIGYDLYIKDGDDWKMIESRNDMNFTEYLYKDAEIGKEYEFKVRAYSTTESGDPETAYGTVIHTHIDYTKSTVTVSKRTASSINIKWKKVEGATGYRAYIYKNGKWNYYKGIKETKFTFDGLEASTKYKVRVRAYFQTDGKTTWGVYSDTVNVETKSKTVKATRIEKLKKDFADGDWCVKITGLKDDAGYAFDYTLAVKGNKIFARYDYKNNKVMRDFEYLADLKTKKVYIIFDDDKTYAVLSGDLANIIRSSMLMMSYAIDMSDAGAVTAKTAIYGGKTGVAETYNVRTLTAKKTCYFVNDKIKAIKMSYYDGSTETLKISKIYDTPSASLFKVPGGYKKIKF